MHIDYRILTLFNHQGYHGFDGIECAIAVHVKCWNVSKITPVGLNSYLLNSATKYLVSEILHNFFYNRVPCALTGVVWQHIFAIKFRGTSWPT